LVFFKYYLTKTGIGGWGEVCTEGNFGGNSVGNGHIVLPKRTNNPKFWGKRNIPWDYHGMSNIPGGVARFYGERHTTKYRDYQGIFAIPAHARHQSFNRRLYHIAKFRHFTKNTATYITGNYIRKTGILHRTIRQYCNKK